MRAGGGYSVCSETTASVNTRLESFPVRLRNAMPERPGQISAETRAAWVLYEEIIQLKEAGSRVAALPAIKAKAKEAARLAPKSPDLLAVLARDLYPFGAFDRSAERLSIEWQ